MTPFLQLTFSLAVIISVAKAGGYISYRLGQPSVLGELLAGILLGPTVIDFLHISLFTDTHLPTLIHELAELGVLFLMFIAGMELHLSDLAKSRKVSLLSGVLGVVFPLLFGLALALFFPIPITEALFLGVILAATSVSISAQTLMELKVLRSRVGIALLGAAVFDDILVVLIFSVFTALAGNTAENGFLSVLLIAVKMVLYLGVATYLGMWLLPRLSRKVDALPISQAIISFTVVMILLFGWTAEVFGNMAAITGTFIAGLVFSRSPVRERIQSGISSLAYGLFIPVFFINVGLSTDARELFGDIFWLFFAMTILAIIGKILGSGLGAWMSGFTKREALQMGIGMMSRGEVGLIVATVGITNGIIPNELFSAVVGVVIITTLLTPPLLRMSFKKKPVEKSVKPEPSS